MEKVYETFGMKLTPLNPVKKDTANFKSGYVPLDRFLNGCTPRERNKILNYGVGVEIEVENSQPTNIEGWLVEADGSLRNNGREFKTKYGLRVYELLPLLIDLSGVFSRNKFQFSERCSVHIHLDVRTLRIADLNSLVVLYTLVEQSLFKLASPARYNNIFCIPHQQSIKGSKTWVSFQDFIKNSEKYSALNFAALKNFGTVEFRQMRGTSNPEDIFRWVLMLAALLCAAETRTLDDLKEDLSVLQTESQYEAYIKSIFGTLSTYLEIDRDHMNESISDAKLFLLNKD